MKAVRRFSGCARLIPFTLLAGACADESSASGPAGALTWSADIVPLMAQHCTSCHTEGGAAPFALETLDDVKAYGELSLDAMEAGRMPPWSADPECRSVEDLRIMDPSDVATFRAWMESGTLAGDERMTAEAAPTEPYVPTHVARLAEPYTPVLGDSDDYRCFVLDLDFDRPMYMHSSTVGPGNGLVHHALVYALSAGQAQEALERDAADDGPGYTCFGLPVELGGMDAGGQGDVPMGGSLLTGSVDIPDMIGVWVPGAVPQSQGEDTSIRIEAGSRIVMQVHYSVVGGEPEADFETEFQAVMTEEPTGWLARNLQLAHPNLEIPAGDASAVETVEVPYYGDELSITGMMGHMHLLGTSMSAEVTRASGATECGLDLHTWDYNWQEWYTFSQDDFLILNSGDRARLSCAYDNSAANQPVINGVQQEPRDVRWGDGTLDEMCVMYMRARVPYFPAPSPNAAPCSESCVAECGSDLACLVGCEGSDPQCFGCALSSVLECDAGAICGAHLASMDQCLTDCMSSAFLLGGDLGACFASECGADWAAMTDCITGVLAEQACPGMEASCGL